MTSATTSGSSTRRRCDPAWITVTGIVVCTSTTRPANAAGLMIYETDTGTSYINDGAGWYLIPTAKTPGTFLQAIAGNTARKVQSGIMVIGMAGAGGNPQVQTLTFPSAFANAPVTTFTGSYILGSIAYTTVNGRPNSSTPNAKTDFTVYNVQSSYTGNLDLRYIATDA